MSEWISVKDRLPADGEDVIAAFVAGSERKSAFARYRKLTYRKSQTNWIFIETYGDWENGPVYILGVTHWMTIPEPPKEEKQ